MSVRRFFLPPEKLSEAEPALTGQEAVHAAKVIRLKPGDVLEVLDGAGRLCRCEIAAISKTSVALRKTGEDLAPPPVSRVHLHASVLRGRAMDSLIQKAAELGVHAIHPLLAERCEVHLKPSDWPSKREKWMHIAVESIKQCGSRWLPRLTDPTIVDERSTKREQGTMSLVAALTESTTTIRSVFAESAPPPRDVHIWIGPEGDFTDAELAGLIAAGARAVTLGSNVLRADTAATVAAALVLHELAAVDNVPTA